VASLGVHRDDCARLGYRDERIVVRIFRFSVGTHKRAQLLQGVLCSVAGVLCSANYACVSGPSILWEDLFGASIVKSREYTEGPEALENFERGMKALFKVPRAAIVPPKKRVKRVSLERKPKKPDKS
jgi:hypothetical protein